MSMVTFGDMAQFQSLRRQGVELRSDMARLTAELASGKVSDKGRALGGNFSTLADITRGLKLNDAFRTSIADAAITAAGRQSALGSIASELEGFGTSLLSLAGLGKTDGQELALLRSSDRFEAAISALSTRIAGQSLFSADAPETAPLIPSEDILSELRTIAATSTDAASLEASVMAWFSDIGGGYETLAWQGGDGASREVLISEGHSAAIGITALDPAIREALAGLALATLATEEGSTLPLDERRSLLTRAGEQVLRSESDLVELRARLGTEEARIEEAKVAAETARGTLQLEYGRLLDADPYTTATELEAVNLQLESLYVLTARMSRLSLTEFLR